MKPPYRVVAVILCVLAAHTPSQTTFFVDEDATGDDTGASWAHAFTSLRSALAIAAPGDEVWVAEGEYRPDTGPGAVQGDRFATFLIPDGVMVLGGFDGTETLRVGRAGSFEQTVLSGDLAQNDGALPAGYEENSLHVVTVTSTGATLNGFRIRAGHADGLSGETTGGGVICLAADIHLQNVVVENCIGTFGGGGVDADGTSQLTMRSCTLRGNRGNDGGAIQAERLTAVDCLFLENVADNGAAAEAGPQVVFVSCRFVGNTATGSGGAVNAPGAASVSFLNCSFSGNDAHDGGAIQCTSSSTVELYSCTVFGNTAESGGGLDLSGGPHVLSNTILWGNSDNNGNGQAAQIRLGQTATAAINFSCILGWNGGLGGIGNFGISPDFVNPAGPDAVLGTLDDSLALGTTSSCIDMGATVLLPLDEYDLDGDGVTQEYVSLDAAGLPRVFDFDADGLAIVDIGSVETQDCNANGGSDAGEIAGGGSADCNSNYIPDECEPDCNGNGEPDGCDISGGDEQDCDGSGIPDSCEILTGVLADTNANGIPDICETCETDLGFQGPGDALISICGQSLLEAENSATFSLTSSHPSTVTFLIVSPFSTPSPLGLGTLVPNIQFAAVLPVPTDRSGGISFPVEGAGGTPTTVFVQAVLPVGAVLELSNALEVIIGT